MNDPIHIETPFMRELAACAAAETLPRFRQNGAIANKLEGGFDPVTEADRAAERAIRDLIGKAFPDHGIVGEEYGSEGADRRHVWVIDPIDGTRAFISGLPLWGTLIGLMEDGRAVAGMMSQHSTPANFSAPVLEHRARFQCTPPHDKTSLRRSPVPTSHPNSKGPTAGL